MACHVPPGALRRRVVAGCVCLIAAVICLHSCLGNNLVDPFASHGEISDGRPLDRGHVGSVGGGWHRGEAPVVDGSLVLSSGAASKPELDRGRKVGLAQLENNHHIPATMPPASPKDQQRRRIPSPPAPPLAPPHPFRTTYRKTHCGAFVTNMCLVGGQPRYTTPDGVLLTRSGATTVCNEAVKKSKLHMVVTRAADQQGLWRTATQGTYMGDHAVLLVPFCWELYGYHLLLCLLSAWANRCRLDEAWCTAAAEGRDDDGPAGRAVVVGFLKGSGLFPYLRGSDTAWDNATPPVVGASGLPLASQAQPTAYWPLWQVLADDPSHVAPLPDLPPMCFPRAFLGHIPSFDVLPHEQQLFRRAMVRRLLGQRTLVASERATMAFGNAACNSAAHDAGGVGRSAATVRVTLIQRRTRYRILNVDAVKAALVRGMARGMQQVSLSVAVRVVSLEVLSVPEQLRLVASETDVLVGVHGNGLSWSMFMPPAAVVMELWPHAPYNTNYPAFCTRSNLFYVAVNGNATCRARCSASYAGAAIEAAATGVAQHLWKTRCQGEAFNATVQFFEAKEQAAKKKRERLLAGR